MVLWVVRSLIEVVRTFHSMGILHAELKLQTVRVDEADYPPTLRVIDFGISAGVWHPSPFTAPRFAPNVRISAPELVRGYNPHIEPAIVSAGASPVEFDENGTVRLSLDIWMLGCLLWQLVTAQLVEEEEPDFFVHRVRSGGVELRTALDGATHVHPVLRDQVLKMLAWNEATRPDAGEIYRDVTSVSFSSPLSDG